MEKENNQVFCKAIPDSEFDEKKHGFKLVKRIDLTPANHEFNSIYIFQKIYGK